MHHAGRKPLGRVVSLALLVALLGVASMALTRCTLTGDNLTGVGLNRSAPTTCIKKCNDDFDKLFKEEQKRHIAAKDYCQTLPANQQGPCNVDEDALHIANKDALTAAKIDCQNGCHHSGTGSAG
ncbi:MAG TPA: hypothetical protein VGK93_07955 [Candidatus Eisenbacteria bacterium]|jgi:hypothetical protein